MARMRIGPAAYLGKARCQRRAMASKVDVGNVEHLVSRRSHRIGIEWQQAVKGLVLLLAVAFDVYNKRRSGN